MKLSEIHEQASKDLAIPMDELDTISTKTPDLYTKYLKYHTHENLVLKKRLQEKKQVYKKLYEYYLGKADDEVYKEKGNFGHKILKQDVNIYIEADNEMVSAEEKYEYQKEKVFYLEKVLKIIEQRSFQINNALSFIKFNHGAG